MDVQVEDTLASVSTLINDCAVAILSKALLGCSLGSHHHQVAEQLLVSRFSLGDASQTITVLWDNQKVLGSNRCDIAEG